MDSFEQKWKRDEAELQRNLEMLCGDQSAYEVALKWAKQYAVDRALFLSDGLKAACDIISSGKQLPTVEG